MPAGPTDPSAGRPASRSSLPGGHEFVRLLGHGSTGSVVLARQVSLNRLVAIKSIMAGDYDRSGQMRLEREGRALVALRHPRIVTLYELRSTSAGPVLIMEFLGGGDLRQRMDSGTLSAVHVVTLLGEIAAALCFAHERGVVHRDVKPANVLLTVDGHAKVADFGLARLGGTPNAFRTSVPGAAGTPSYMAPEQILNPDQELPASDTYAFTVLAYELLTGARPYVTSGVADVITAHLYAPPVPPWLLAPGLPMGVGHALLAGLAKQPQDRPPLRRIAEEIAGVPAGTWVQLFQDRPRAPESPTPPVEATVGAESGVSPVVVRSFVDVPEPTSATPPPPAPRVATGKRPLVSQLALIAFALLAGAAVGIVVVLLASRA